MTEAKLQPLEDVLDSTELEEAIDKLTIVLLKGYGEEITGVDAVALISAGAAGLSSIGYENKNIFMLTIEILKMLKDLDIESHPRDREPEAGKES